MKFITINERGVIDSMRIELPADGRAFTEQESAAMAARGFIPVTDAQWQSIGPDYRFIEGVLLPPAAIPAAQRLEEAKAAQKNALKNACQDFLLAGFSADALGSDYRYPSQITDQQNLSSAASAQTGAYLWCAKEAEWSLKSHTPAQVQAVRVAWVTYLNAAQQKLVSLMDDVENTTTPEEAAAVVWRD
ncbi:hypothetical protein ORG37_26165 [Rahnella perminowiae]|uniref:DUF4376 domain-containing protein n=1 Tax=Rahnella perminowiae TaxID=2816244 RepID=UPI00224A51BE|nr:hypothetical protein [Rahnella perminowiae]MCX2946566.1 hypothetical protein [Rahnella perminowiae]